MSIADSFRCGQLGELTFDHHRVPFPKLFYEKCKKSVFFRGARVGVWDILFPSNGYLKSISQHKISHLVMDPSETDERTDLHLKHGRSRLLDSSRCMLIDREGEVIERSSDGSMRVKQKL